MIISIALSVLLIVALWKVFIKAGEPGWKCLIPIYNVYMLFKIAHNDGFVKMIVAGIIMIVLSVAAGGIISYGIIATSVGGIMAGVVFFIAVIAVMVYVLVLQYKMYADLAEAFGHERVFAWGLLLLQPIFICILGFESSTYAFAQDNVGNDVTPESVVVEDK
ncbi:MAG: DUF5684 domain-containing protein [Lachnospiraceae bacterium]|nr:DUF5684 domain-containing protein [Lachnospiraceae bacterium]